MGWGTKKKTQGAGCGRCSLSRPRYSGYWPTESPLGEPDSVTKSVHGGHKAVSRFEAPWGDRVVEWGEKTGGPVAGVALLVVPGPLRTQATGQLSHSSMGRNLQPSQSTGETKRSLGSWHPGVTGRWGGGLKRQGAGCRRCSSLRPRASTYSGYWPAEILSRMGRTLAVAYPTTSSSGKQSVLSVRGILG